MTDKTSRYTGRLTLPPDYRTDLSDFALFLSVMNNKRAYECMLGIILDEPDLKLAEVRTEQVVLNQYGRRAIRLDALALEAANGNGERTARHFDTEMQNDAAQDSLPRRARFYQGLMDAPLLKSGRTTKYRNLPETVIIFITQEDFFGKDLALYTFTEQCEDIPGLRLNDGTKKLFLNMASKNGRAELVSLLQYMKHTTLDNPGIITMDERIVELDGIVQEVKESKEWEVVKMNLVEYGIERGIKRGKELGRQEGEAAGRREGTLQTLTSLVKSGLLELSQAAEQAGISEAEFLDLMKK